MLDAMRTEAGESEPVRAHDCPAEVYDVADDLTLAPTPLNLLALAWAMARGEFAPAAA
jgi:hypothetical protein